MSDDSFSNPSSAPSSAGGKLKSLVVGLAFAVLLGAVAYLWSERNHRTYSVVRRAGNLVVMRGLMLPAGSEPYHPADRSFADAYAPIPIQNDSPGDLLDKTYADRDELDRELFRTLQSWIAARLAADSPDQFAEGVAYLRRAEKLVGLTEDQRKQVADLRAEAAYFEGRAKLDESLASLEDAVEKLELAAASRSRHAAEAAALFAQVSGPARAAMRAGRATPAAAAPVAAVPPPSATPAPLPARPEMPAQNDKAN